MGSIGYVRAELVNYNGTLSPFLSLLFNTFSTFSISEVWVFRILRVHILQGTVEDCSLNMFWFCLPFYSLYEFSCQVITGLHWHRELRASWKIGAHPPPPSPRHRHCHRSRRYGDIPAAADEATATATTTSAVLLLDLCVSSSIFLYVCSAILDLLQAVWCHASTAALPPSANILESIRVLLLYEATPWISSLGNECLNAHMCLWRVPAPP